MTTHTTHTPGPWRVDSMPGRKSVITTQDLMTDIAIVEADGEDDPRHVYNARLIAAAPELLQMLKDSLYGLQYASAVQPLQGHPKHEDTEHGYYVQNLIKDIKRAIAKAEGG